MSQQIQRTEENLNWLKSSGNGFDETGRERCYLMTFEKGGKCRRGINCSFSHEPRSLIPLYLQPDGTISILSLDMRRKRYENKDQN